MSSRLRLQIRTLMLVLGGAIYFAVCSEVLAFTPEFIQPSQDCSSVLKRLTADPNWFNNLLDPVITNQDELLRQLALYVEAHECLIKADTSTPPELLAAIPYLEYFRIFALGYGTPVEDTTLRLVDLANSDDQAVRELRDIGGLAAPKGDIFVRFYRSRQVMPARIQQLFGQDTAGLTLLTRYVAILEDDPISWEEQALQAQRLPKTISHELVHAFMNASVGIDGLDQLPRWYAEGVAIYLSNSGEDHVVVGPDFKITSTSPQDYKDFRDQFKYLEAKLGKERLLETIRISIEEVEPAFVYQDLGFKSDDEFIKAAEAYWQRRFYLVSAVIIAGLVLGVWGLLSLMPDIRCPNCHYAGKKREFSSGYCPNCHYPFQG